MTRSHRDEFPAKVRKAVFRRALDKHGVGHCESPACRAVLKVGEGEIDHILPVALGGEPTISNARLLCVPCHKAKSALDVKMISKSNRQWNKHTGAVRPKQSIRSPSFAQSPKHSARQQKREFQATQAALASKFNLGMRARP